MCLCILYQLFENIWAKKIVNLKIQLEKNRKLLHVLFLKKKIVNRAFYRSINRIVYASERRFHLLNF